MSGTRKKSDAELEKLRLEYLFDNGIDFESRTIQLTGSISSDADVGSVVSIIDFEYLDSRMSELERKSLEHPIILKINSPGGEIYEAYAMVGRILNSPCQIITEGYGQVASAATLILMAGNLRRLSKHCNVMYHQMSYGVAGEHANNQDFVKQCEKEHQRTLQYYAEHSEKTVAFWKKAIDKKEYYPTPEEMLVMDAVDELF